MFVKLWMSHNPIALLPSQTVAEAENLMRQHGVRHLPVADAEGRLVGMVSAYDIAGVQPAKTAGDRAARSSASLPVERIMSRQPPTIEPLTPLETVARQMRRHKMSGMPVVEDGKLRGVFTESDLCAACMTLLGDGSGTRVEMLVGTVGHGGRRALANIFTLCQRHGVAVLACALHRDYSDEQQLLTLRLTGDDLTELLAALPSAGATVYRVIEEEL